MTNGLDATTDRDRRPTARSSRLLRGLAIGVGVLALLSACTDDESGDGRGGTQPAAGSDSGGGDSGGGDSGGGDSGGGDSGGGDSGGGDSGGGDSGGGDSGGGDSGGGDSGGGDSGGGDSGGGDSGGGDSGGTTAPAPESDDGLTTEEWVLLILLGVAVIAIIIGATSAATNHSQNKDAHRRTLNRQLSGITSGARWVSDQATTSVLQATTADQLQSNWQTARSHMVDLEGQIAKAAGNTGDGDLDQSLSTLGRSLASLRGALESNVQLRLRSDAADQTDAIRSSTDTVTQRRHQLDNALVPVLAAQQ